MVSTIVSLTPPASVPLTQQTTTFPSSYDDGREYATMDLNIVQSETIGSTAQPKVTFSPVSEAVLTEIMGYVSLGLNEIGINSEAIPTMIFKWHTWLKRMNAWMKKNETEYPKFMSLPPVTITANLYFMANISPNDYVQQSAKVAIAPLGPLLPTEKNTLINALKKGISTCGKTYGNASEKENSLTSFVNDLDKLATYAIQPQKESLEANMLIPIPHVGKTTVNNTSSQILQYGGNEKSDAMYEHFTGIDDEYDDNSYVKKNYTTNRFKFPIWVWVGLLMCIIYFYVKRGNMQNLSALGSANGPMIGGSNDFQPILNISDF